MPLSSCTDILDQAPDGKVSMEEVLANVDYVETWFNTCYGWVGTDGTQYLIHGKGFHYWWWETRACCSDEAYSSDEAYDGGLSYNFYNDVNTAAAHSLDGGTKANTYWVRYFTQVSQCSKFLTAISQPSTAVRSEELREQMKAEVLVLRAFYLMELFKYYGSLPILPESGEIPIDADYSDLKRGTAYETAQQIIADCDAALAISELPWRIVETANAGRMTKAVAWALKSEAMLFAASPLFNSGQNYWEEAYNISKNAVAELKANGYALFTNCTQPDVFGTGPAAAYRQLACQTADYSASPRDRETIYQVSGDPYDWAGHIWHIGYIGSNMPVTYKCGAGPTQEFVDAFETSDGKPVLDLKQPYLDEYHLQPNYNTANTTYNRQNPYVNRDPRFYETVIYNGSHILWQGEGDDENSIIDWEIQIYENGRHHPSHDVTEYRFTRTGYYPCKMVTPGACALNDIINARWKYYRLGETLLNLAETAAEAGHNNEALAAVNEVRARSGMPAINSSVTGEELRLRIQNERRVELSWEENRYFDMRRWRRPTEDLSATAKWFTCMWITKSGSTFNYERRSINLNPRGGWQNRDLLLPIPLDEASLLSSYTGENWQNPGW
jgi:hypothetical protein